MNKVVTQGLKIETEARYLKFTESTATKVVNHVETSVLEVYFVKGRKASDVVFKGIDLIEDIPLKETEYIELRTVLFKIDGFIFRKLTLGNINFSQMIVEGISEFVLYVNDITLILLIPPTRLKDYKSYIQALNCSKMLEFIDVDQCEKITNIGPILISDSDFCIESDNLKIHKTVEQYSKYTLRGVDVLYEYLKGLGKILEEYGMELLGYPIDKSPTSSNYIRWRLTSKDKHVQRKSGWNYIDHTVQCISELSMNVNITDLEMFEDFIFKYQHYRLITNYTQWLVEDKLGNQWLASALYDSIATDFDNSQASNEDGQYAYTTSFSVKLYYYIVEDAKAYQLFMNLESILEDLDNPLSSLMRF